MFTTIPNHHKILTSNKTTKMKIKETNIKKNINVTKDKEKHVEKDSGKKKDELTVNPDPEIDKPLK